ncbi:hypothetical protein [Actinacidiphila glaucinigra]|uniref:hypothetical protein n=1 Tax=Actinacidiphila glaucinigra TaxID=235986 RepID=UPI002E351764|nr:hypothetical protein [Actinacidiphila glaucinigra]
MRARRFLATRFSGLWLDATAGGAQMGGVLSLASGHVRFAVDLERGPDWLGKPLDFQVLRPGSGAPAVAEVVPATSGSRRVHRPARRRGRRLGGAAHLDPSHPNGQPGPAGQPCNDLGAAYSAELVAGALTARVP